jgi:NarL family two-component system response regulator LiaR
MRGEAVIPASMSHYVLEQLSGLSRELNQLRQGEARNELSHREFEVAALVAEGHTNQEIAHELSISILTAKNHVHNILSKLEASSRREIAVRFRRSGILRSGSGKSN